jgi:hypothetical protein
MPLTNNYNTRHNIIHYIFLLDFCLYSIYNFSSFLYALTPSVVMVSVLASSVVDCGFKPWSCQTNDYKIGICCFSAKHAALRRKSNDWMARNRDNMSEWGAMSISRMLFQWASTIKNPTKSVGLVPCTPHHHLIELTCSDIAEIVLSWH